MPLGGHPPGDPNTPSFQWVFYPEENSVSGAPDAGGVITGLELVSGKPDQPTAHPGNRSEPNLLEVSEGVSGTQARVQKLFDSAVVRDCCIEGVPGIKLRRRRTHGSAHRNQHLPCRSADATRHFRFVYQINLAPSMICRAGLARSATALMRPNEAVPNDRPGLANTARFNVLNDSPRS